MVFPIQACFFVNQAEPISSLIRRFLLKWRNAEGETNLNEITNCIYWQYETLWDLLNQHFQDEKVVVDTFCEHVEELQVCKIKPVIFLIDQCNVFNSNSQTIKFYFRMESYTHRCLDKHLLFTKKTFKSWHDILYVWLCRDG